MGYVTSAVLGDFFAYIVILVNPKNGRAAPMISEETYQAVMDNRDVLDSAIIYDRDFAYNYVSATSVKFCSDVLTIPVSSLLVRFQDTRKILPPAHRRQDRGATSTHDHASCCRYSRSRRRKGHRDLQLDVRALLHSRLAHLVQRRNTASSIVVVLLGRHEGRLY